MSQVEINLLKQRIDLLESMINSGGGSNVTKYSGGVSNANQYSITCIAKTKIFANEPVLISGSTSTGESYSNAYQFSGGLEIDKYASVVGVALTPAIPGELVRVQVSGVVEVKKGSSKITAGVPLWCNDNPYVEISGPGVLADATAYNDNSEPTRPLKHALNDKNLHTKFIGNSGARTHFIALSDAQSTDKTVLVRFSEDLSSRGVMAKVVAPIPDTGWNPAEKDRNESRVVDILEFGDEGKSELNQIPLTLLNEEADGLMQVDSYLQVTLIGGRAYGIKSSAGGDIFFFRVVTVDSPSTYQGNVFTTKVSAEENVGFDGEGAPILASDGGYRLNTALVIGEIEHYVSGTLYIDDIASAVGSGGAWTIIGKLAIEMTAVIKSGGPNTYVVDLYDGANLVNLDFSINTEYPVIGVIPPGVTLPTKLTGEDTLVISPLTLPGG